MARSCPVCRHPQADQINIACQNGTGNQQIAQDYGLDRASIENHRSSGHAGRAITEMLLRAADRPELQNLAAVAIARKQHRVEVLDRLLSRVLDEVESQDKGKLSPNLIKEARGLLETASKEMGEWRPDGGEKAESTARLAQSIVIHSAAVAGVLSADSATSRNVENNLSIDVQAADITEDSGTGVE